MALRQIGPKNQITIPPAVLRAVGASAGAMFAIRVEKRGILLEPRTVVAQKDAEFEEKDWDRLDALVTSQVRCRKYREYATVEDARKHIRRLTR